MHISFCSGSPAGSPEPRKQATPSEDPPSAWSTLCSCLESPAPPSALGPALLPALLGHPSPSSLPHPRPSFLLPQFLSHTCVTALMYVTCCTYSSILSPAGLGCAPGKGGKLCIPTTIRSLADRPSVNTGRKRVEINGEKWGPGLEVFEILPLATDDLDLPCDHVRLKPDRTRPGPAEATL